MLVGEVSASATPAKQPNPAKVDPFSLTLPPSENAFGEGVPFGDPCWYQDWNSPYYNDSHKRFRAAMRAFIDREIMPYTHEWEEKKRIPKELYKKCFEAGWLAGTASGARWPTEYVGDHIAGGVKPEEFDAFHMLILIDEICRCGSGGVSLAMFGGLGIGLPPVLHFGSQYLKDKVAKDCLTGEKIICLAITEPYAGSDVAQLRCEARKTPDGSHYIVNGEKKWITNGVFADYFTVAVRTGGDGAKGISMLLIEKERAGVKVRQMDCSGLWPSGTTYVTFEDVKVPTANLIGKENQGFKYIVANFNGERWGIAVQALRFARVCIEESIKYAHKRKTFGVRLIDHGVIRHKLGNMIRQVEASQAWVELITYQFCTMNSFEAVLRLGGAIALLKAHCTNVFEYCVRESGQIFGGLAYTRGGQGEKVERLYREGPTATRPQFISAVTYTFCILQFVPILFSVDLRKSCSTLQRAWRSKRPRCKDPTPVCSSGVNFTAGCLMHFV